ncbi:MAG: HAD family hydrolase [Motiliproteus sp.]|nr:HAD family hydrolase [Motiliproteus sp.]
MIRVITFDLDDTLWAVDPVIKKANQTLYRWLSERAPAFTERYQISDFATLQRQVVERHPHWAHSVTAIRLGVLREGLIASGYHGRQLEQQVEQAFDCFLKARNQVAFFNHAIHMLDQLHGRYQLGALSNGNADIELVGLGDHFDFCFNADQVGSAKPDPLMFEKMLEFTGAQANEVVHVGDNPSHDIQGAHNAGVYSLWVNLEQIKWPGGTPATLEVQCLSEIPAAIYRLNDQLT